MITAAVSPGNIRANHSRDTTICHRPGAVTSAGHEHHIHTPIHVLAVALPHHSRYPKGPGGVIRRGQRTRRPAPLTPERRAPASARPCECCMSPNCGLCPARAETPPCPTPLQKGFWSRRRYLAWKPAKPWRWVLPFLRHATEDTKPGVRPAWTFEPALGFCRSASGCRAAWQYLPFRRGPPLMYRRPLPPCWKPTKLRPGNIIRAAGIVIALRRLPPDQQPFSRRQPAEPIEAVFSARPSTRAQVLIGSRIRAWRAKLATRSNR